MSAAGTKFSRFKLNMQFYTVSLVIKINKTKFHLRKKKKQTTWTKGLWSKGAITADGQKMSPHHHYINAWTDTAAQYNVFRKPSCRVLAETCSNKICIGIYLYINIKKKSTTDTQVSFKKKNFGVNVHRDKSSTAYWQIAL